MIGLELKCDLETKFLTSKVRFGLMEVIYLDREKREEEEATIDQDAQDKSKKDPNDFMKKNSFTLQQH